jgi:hypothetical protein
MPSSLVRSPDSRALFSCSCHQQALFLVVVPTCPPTVSPAPSMICE